MKQTALITGGSRGIGMAIALRLGQDGYNIAIVARSEKSKVKENLECLQNANISYCYIQADISSREDRERIMNETLETFGRIDVLVNNAGVAPLVRNDLLEMTEESFDRVININMKSNMFLTQLVAKQMLKQDIIAKKRGTIINISSCSAAVVSVERGEYCLSKAGVSMLTQLYAARLAQDGILVYEVRPGVIDTDMTAASKAKYDALIEQGIFPIERWGTPEDVAGVVSAFAGNDFMYTTGNYIDVDGGFHIRRL